MEDPPRVDDACRHLVAREREVVDLDALVVGRPRSASRSRCVAGADVDRERTRRAERVVELRQRGRERAVGVGAGHREQRAAGGEERDAFGRREAQRSLEVLGEADLDAAVDHRHVDEPVGGVGRQPAHRQQLEVAFELALRHLEARRELGEGDARDGRGSTARARARAARRGPTSGRLTRVRAPGDVASSHATMSARSSGGASTSAWSRRSSTHDRNAARFTTGSAHDDRAVGSPLDDRLVAELVDHPAGAGARRRARGRRPAGPRRRSWGRRARSRRGRRRGAG